LDLDSLAARSGSGKAPAPALDSVRSTSADRAVRTVRAVRTEGTSHRAARTDLNNAPAAARSSAANHNRVHRSATSAGTLGVAGYQLSEILAAQSPTAEAEQQAEAEVLRLDIAARPVLER
jgi:hypothetical protein